MIIIFFTFVNSFWKLLQLFGVSEDTFLKCMDVLMDVLIANYNTSSNGQNHLNFKNLRLNLTKLDASSQMW